MGRCSLLLYEQTSSSTIDFVLPLTIYYYYHLTNQMFICLNSSNREKTSHKNFSIFLFPNMGLVTLILWVVTHLGVIYQIFTLGFLTEAKLQL